MKTIVELRQELVELFGKLKSEEIKPKQAKEMNNSAGKIINTLRAEMEYAQLNTRKPKIAFLETGAK